MPGGVFEPTHGGLTEARCCGVPFAPELFSAPELQRVLDKYRGERLRSVPFFDGLMTGEIDALLESFAGVPEVHHPVRGRIKGETAFRRFVTDTTSWLAERNVEVEHVNFLITEPRRVEEVVLHLDGDGGRVGLPFALACDHEEEDERIVELRLYFSTWPLTGRHENRPPLLQPDPRRSRARRHRRVSARARDRRRGSDPRSLRAGRVHARGRRRRRRPPGHR